MVNVFNFLCKGKRKVCESTKTKRSKWKKTVNLVDKPVIREMKFIHLNLSLTLEVLVEGGKVLEVVNGVDQTFGGSLNRIRRGLNELQNIFSGFDALVGVLQDPLDN